jgi:serine/threonine-protein kinase HipA
MNQYAKLSISGIQVKHSAKLEDNQIILTDIGGEYIIKPVPVGTFKNLSATPANEHITMQLANQVFNISTPANALLNFNDGEPAYIVKRFDVLPNGKKLLQEDLAQLSGRTEENFGKNYKYDFSYEEIAIILKEFIGAYPVVIENFFSIILYNYLICNGDAHLKNFSVFRNEEFGDYTLTPAYDLLNTSLHVPDESDMALDLFKDNFMTEAYKHGSKYTQEDFRVFGNKIGISEKRVRKILDSFISKKSQAVQLLEISFLDQILKSQFIDSMVTRFERIKYTIE